MGPTHKFLDLRSLSTTHIMPSIQSLLPHRSSSFSPDFAANKSVDPWLLRSVIVLRVSSPLDLHLIFLFNQLVLLSRSRGEDTGETFTN
ncbi:hypothetical protein LguiA_008446 [Lonicera macranthoides]